MKTLDVKNNSSEYVTIRNMRFQLRMYGIFDLEYYSDNEIVKLFNLTFNNYTFTGIDINGKLIPYS